MNPNVELIRRGYEAFAQGDLATLTELLSPDFVWVAEAGGILRGRFDGRDAVFAIWARIPAETEGTYQQEVTGIYADDHVAVATTTATGTRRGKSFDGARGATVFEITDGVVTSGRLISADPDFDDDFWAE